MRVAPDVISQHFSTNLLRAILKACAEQNYFQLRRARSHGQNVLPLKVEAHATLTGDIMYMEPTYCRLAPCISHSTVVLCI